MYQHVIVGLLDVNLICFTFETRSVIHNTRHIVGNMKGKCEAYHHICTCMSFRFFVSTTTVLQLRILAPAVEGSLPLWTSFCINLLVNIFQEEGNFELYEECL
jgi:hypothetical protein